jgi:subtilisin family serine protease
LGSLLVLILILLVGNRWGMDSSSPAELGNHDGSARVIDPKTQEIPLIAESDVPSPTVATLLPEQVAQEEVVVGQQAPKNWIKQVIAEEWTDGAEKLAGRQRVRIVVADFKYPHLRIEESVATDPTTGLETVTFLRASVADHLMLGLKPGADFKRAAVALREKGYAVRGIEPGSFILAELPEFAAADDQSKAAADLALSEEFVNYAEPDYLVFPSIAPNDPAYAQGKMWGLHNPGATADSKADADIDAPEAWDIRKEAPNIVVAVTDTGIKHDHEDLIANRWTHPTTSGVYGYDAYDNDNEPMDTGGHGTHCAGTIGARGGNSLGLTGVAWNVKLMGVRFLGPNGGSTSDAIKVINYSRLNGADLISASWGGGGYSQGLSDAITACADAGIPFVAAAGNSSTNNDSTPHYPSSYNARNIISVASTTKSDTLSTFSCYGRTSVDIAAPGSGIWSSYIGSANSYTFLNGTSMATPHVSGALALAMAQFPDDDMAAIIARLYASVDKIPALAGKVSTGGRLNLSKLLGNAATPTISNDHFANALRFEGYYGAWAGSNAGASRETGEDAFSMPDTGDKSLWFAFHTPHSGRVTLNFSSHVLWYSYVVYEGSVKGELKPVKVSGIFDSYLREFSFTSKPNTEYRIVVDSFHNPSQTFRVDYLLTPPNDFFADATPLSGDLFSVSGNNRAASEELFEVKKRHAGTGQGKTVWWKWTAPANMDFTINTVGSAFDTVLAVYTGETTESLTEVATSDDRNALDWTSQVTFAAVAGTTYHIVVDSFREDAAGDITLNGFRSGSLTILRQPANVSVPIGKRAVFEISVLSSSDISYQWFFNDEAIPGQTSANLVIDPAQASNFGNYKVQIWSAENTVTSNTVTLSEQQIAPKLVWSSGNQAVAAGTSVPLSANFSGSTPLTYTWTKNGQSIPGTSSILNFASTTTTDSGNYRLTATNSAGSATADFTLSVVASPWERWEWRRPGIPNAAISDIKVYGAEAFAVSGTMLFRSTDGVNWNKSLFPQGFMANSLAKIGNLLVCNGLDANGLLRVAISTDNGTTWTIQLTTGLPTTNQPEKFVLLSFGSYFIAYSSNGQDFFRSTNGTAWTRLTATNLAGQTVNLTGKGRIATDGSKLILASASSDSSYRLQYFKSTNGLNWTEHRTTEGPTTGSSAPTSTAAYAMGKFHLIGVYSVYTSVDLETWQYHYAPSNGFSESSLFASNSDTLFAFQSGSQTLRYYSSPDVRKLLNLQPANSHFFSAAATFGTKVLYGTDKGLIGLAADPFGVVIPREKSSTIQSVEFTENLFIARTTNPSTASNAVTDQVSGDGVTWKQSTLLDALNVTITGHGLGKYYGTRSFQTSVFSGHNPFDLRLNANDSIGIAPNISFIGQLPDGAALAVSSPSSGSPAMLTRASNATTWSTASFPLSLNVASKFASIGNRWYSNFDSSSSALIYTSTTGQSWASTGLTGSNAHFASFGGKSWCFYQTASSPLAISAASTSSTNGTGWVAAPTSGLPSISSSKFTKRIVAFGNFLVMLGSDEKLYYSENGTAWIRGVTPGPVVDVAVGNQQLVAIMKNGGIIQTGTRHPGGSAPLVSIISPQTASTHLISSRITIEGIISDPEEGAANYECYMDSVLVASGIGTSFRFTVTTADRNGHTITVRARDSHGLRQMDAIRLKVAGAEPENLLTNGTVPARFAATLDGVFYAAASRAIYRSIDGTSWEKMPIPSFANSIYGMAAGNGALVIQFDNGAIMSTRDGVNWTHFSPNLTSYWVREPIRFSSGSFIAAYQTQGTSTGSVMTSADGLRWETGSISQEGYMSWTANSDDGTIIGAVGSSNGINRTIDNGFNWLPIAPLATGSIYNSKGIFADGRFVVAITNTNGANRVFVSTDSWSWSDQSMPSGVTGAPSLAHIGGLYFIGSSPNLSQISTDATTWQPMSRSVNASKITYARGLFVAEASSGGIVTSRDGITWAATSGLPNTVTRILSNERTYLLIGTNGSVWTSPDGIAWANTMVGGGVSTGSSDTRVGFSMAELNGRIVIAGFKLLVTSADNARSWTNTTVNGFAPSTSNTFHKVVSSGSELLVFEGSFSSPNTLRRSTNGTAFITVGGLPAKTWADLAWSGTEWMLLATDGSLFRSINGGLNWTQLAVSGMARGAALAWFNNRWVIIGSPLSSSSSPYTGYTLGAGDVLQSHGSIGFYNSNQPVRTLIAHGRLVIWARGENAAVTSNGTSWATSNLSDVGNNDYDIYRTAEGFTAFNGSTVAYYPVNAWSAGPDGITWNTIASPFNSIQYADNLGDRVFLFTNGLISELHDKDLALTIASLSSVNLGVGDLASARVRVSNFGRALPPGSTWRVTGWLAKNRFYGDTKNIPLGTYDFTAPMPVPGASAEYDVSFALPNEVLTGSNYLILSLSSTSGVQETNTANNSVISETAAITIPEWEFSVATSGNGQVNRDFAAMRYPHKSQVSLTASAGKGATFTGWGGDALGAESQITVYMDGNKSVSASFSNRATLQVFVNGAGTISNLSDGGSYPVGQAASITAAPAPGWVFSRWSGDSTTTQSTASIHMDGSKTVTAHFVLPMATWKSTHFNATQLADANISGDNKDPDQDGVENWKEYLHGSNPMDRNAKGVSPVEIEAGFLRCIYTRNLGAAVGGSVTCQASRNLSNWNAPGLQERVLATINGIQTIEARLPVAGNSSGFLRFLYTTPQLSNLATLQVFLNGAGAISGLSDGGSYPVGQTAAITAAPAPGWVFSRWSGDSTTTQPTASILMDSSKTVTAHFVWPEASWKSSHFNAAQLADANISGDNKDPDQDGIENWKEYLHGSNPMDRNAKGVSPVEIESGFLRCIYTRNLGAAVGGSVTCQASRNLSNWNAPGLQERVLSTINGIQTIEARLPVAGNSSGFLRFLYTAPQP